MQPVVLDTSALSVQAVEDVARRGARVTIAPEAVEALCDGRQALEQALGATGALYGVNTGFGSLGRTRIAPDDIRAVQRNLVRSHAAGVGEPFPDDVVRAMLLLLCASLCRGKSGVRPEAAQAIADLLNAGVTPVTPSIGSVGASGDLAPLAHCALALIGEGEVVYKGERMRAAAALHHAGLEPFVLDSKEGLALLNGTHLMAAQGALLLADLARVFDAALDAAAMSIDACRGSDSFLDPRVYEARNQPGPTHVAHELAQRIHGSAIIPSHLHDDPRVQDPYSLRCAPMILGAAHDAMAYARAAIEHELGAVTDNPLVFPPDDRPRPAEGSHAADAVISAGAFHGMPLAIPLDTLAIALSHVAGVSERRVYYILSASDEQNPLNPHLSPQPGLHSGLMIAQYTAAACVNEMMGLATPASVANIPTSAGMEDYNSFGPRSAAKARRSLELCANVVAIELLCAAEAMEYQRPLRSGEGVERAYATVRNVVPRLTEDRPPAPDIAALTRLIFEGRFGKH
ncbi:MAG: histidine ammonia-lyase [Phycisphaerales bacterium]|nr:MAG: histidine ammonia-lyase [Phycisphaerales bacterium]